MNTNPFSDLLQTQELSDVMLTFYALYIGFILVFSIVFGIISYILQGKSMYTIAKRRGIEKPWLAWVPVGNMWLLGCISDQFRSLSYGQHTKRRRNLLVLTIILEVVALLFLGGLFKLIFTEMSHGNDLNYIAPLIPEMLVGLYGFLGVAIAASILQYMCYFDLFRSCQPNRSVLYLILSILIGYPLPFFIYACRNKDLGMPPRGTTGTVTGPEYYT